MLFETMRSPLEEVQKLGNATPTTRSAAAEVVGAQPRSCLILLLDYVRNRRFACCDSLFCWRCFLLGSGEALLPKTCPRPCDVNGKGKARVAYSLWQWKTGCLSLFCLPLLQSTPSGGPRGHANLNDLKGLAVRLSLGHCRRSCSTTLSCSYLAGSARVSCLVAGFSLVTFGYRRVMRCSPRSAIDPALALKGQDHHPPWLVGRRLNEQRWPCSYCGFSGGVMGQSPPARWSRCPFLVVFKVVWRTLNRLQHHRGFLSAEQGQTDEYEGCQAS